MAKVTFRFLKPNAWYGHVICWRLCEPYSHAVVIIDDVAFSSTFPRVIKVAATDPRVHMPPREGVDMSLEIDDAVADLLIRWCESRVGKKYDYLSALGWALFSRRIECEDTDYCYEFCREALVRAGLLTRTDELISAERLMLDLYRIGARDVIIQSVVLSPEPI